MLCDVRPLALALALAACSGPAPVDGGTDAGGSDLEFEAVPDPSERTDCPSAPPAAGEARAKHVTCASELVAGSLAMGRIGDIVIENARARFVVRTGAEAATTIGAPAGGVIDAAPQAGADALKELFPLFDVASMRPSAIEVIGAGGEEARVRVLFEAAPIGLIDTVLPSGGRPTQLRGRIDYVLRADADALDVELALTTPRGVARASTAAGVLALIGGMERWQPGYAVIDDDHLGGGGRAVLVGEREGGAIAVGLAASGSLTAIGTIHLLRGERIPLVRGELTPLTARLGVGATAAEALAAASPSDEPALVLRGAPADRVEVAREDGALALRSRFDGEGVARVALPPGSYLVRSGFGAHFAPDAAAVDHPGAEVTVDPAPAATLTVAASVEGDPAAPVRVTVERGGEELERFVAMGETSRRLPPGELRVTVSHGLEHDVSIADLTLAAGESARLEPDLARVLDTSGWVSVDLHLHSDLSTDSVHAVEDAVRMLAAEGVDAAAATDHDFVTDYPAVAARAGVGDRLLVVPGVEVSTTVFGHINGYPLVPDPDRAGAGAPVWFDRSPAEIFEALRALGDDALGGALVQINHPRLGDASFFGSVGLDRETGRATADPSTLGLPGETDLDDFGFEVLEVWNGYTRGGNEESFEDYLALWAAGRPFTMVGNSDSHRADRPPGSPRSFVAVADDAAPSWSELSAGLRAGRVTVAAGVFVTAELAGPRAGDSVPLRVVVQAPPWAATDRLRVYAGRVAVIDRAMDGAGAPLRLDEVIDVPLGGASFVVVRVDGDAAPEPMQHFPPVGVTNPIAVP